MKRERNFYYHKPHNLEVGNLKREYDVERSFVFILITFVCCLVLERDENSNFGLIKVGEYFTTLNPIKNHKF